MSDDLLSFLFLAALVAIAAVVGHFHPHRRTP